MLFYTDGACKTNPGAGGYACIVHDMNLGMYVGYYGMESNTTNNRMELMGMLTAFEYISKHFNKMSDIIVFSDSQYVVKGVNEWMNGWHKNGWKNAAKEPVKNPDLWQKLYKIYHGIKMQLEESNGSKIIIKWIKAHTVSKIPMVNAEIEQNVVGNHLADMLASCSADKIETGQKMHDKCECSKYLQQIILID